MHVLHNANFRMKMIALVNNMACDKTVTLNLFIDALFQEANKRNNSWLPPPWAIVAILVLGFNEFMTLLR